MEAVSGYTRAGIGYFPPPELALSLGARAEEIVSKLEQEEPFDEDYHTPESSIHASRPTTLAPQLSVGGIPQVSAIVAQERELVASVAPVGVLSPIAEQPGSENTPSPTTSPHSTSLAPLPPRSSGEEALPSERVVHGYREAAEIDMRRYPLQEPVTQFQQVGCLLTLEINGTSTLPPSLPPSLPPRRTYHQEMMATTLSTGITSSMMSNLWEKEGLARVYPAKT